MSPEAAPDLPLLRGGFELTGSGAWLMQTVIGQRLDDLYGFRLELRLGDDRVRAGRQSTEARLIENEVDLIDTDWLSLARYRRTGLPLVAVAPYGAIFGALVAPADGGVVSLADLPGKRIGVVREQDKNWLLLRFACRELGFDPARQCTLQACGSKSRLRDELEAGRLDAALVYWHQVPALVAGGRFVEVCDLLDLLPPGAGRGVPSTFFVCHERLLVEQPEVVHGLAGAIHAAARTLRDDEALWRCVSGAEPCHAEQLRKRWMARVGLPWTPAMAAELASLALRLEGKPLPDGWLAADLTH